MDVISIAEARAGLSSLVAQLRSDPDAEPVTIGSHRKPEAVLLPVEAYRRLSDRPIGVPLARLRQLAPVIRRLAEAAHLGDVRVFGSVARGQERDGSDVDLLVTTEDGATLFDIAQFEMDMEALLGVPVSAVPVTALDPARDSVIIAEATSL